MAVQATKKKRTLNDDSSDDNDGFKVVHLPLQNIDYTTCWAEHWRNQNADPAMALRDLVTTSTHGRQFAAAI